MTKQSGYATKQTGYFWTKQLGLNNRVCQVAGMFLCRFAGYNDGTRSVVFKIERIDIQENEEEKQ